MPWKLWRDPQWRTVWIVHSKMTHWRGGPNREKCCTIQLTHTCQQNRWGERRALFAASGGHSELVGRDDAPDYAAAIVPWLNGDDGPISKVGRRPEAVVDLDPLNNLADAIRHMKRIEPMATWHQWLDAHRHEGAQ